MSEALDPVDARILDLIQHDASLSVAEIAERVGLSSSPCWRRIKRLEDEGVIQRRVTILDREKLGLNFEVYCTVKLSLPTKDNLETFEQSVKRWPEVVQCATVTGAADYELRILTRDMHTFDDFLRDKILSLGLVSNIESRIVVRAVKNATTVPLGLISSYVVTRVYQTGESPVIDLVIDARRRDIGGFEVGRLLPYAHHRMVGPFVFFDHMGPMDFAPGFPRSVDVRPHPHIGLSTVTYLFEGEITHRDSVGSEIAITPGEMNWMTAGRGITHSERFDRLRQSGGRMHGIQAWVALPERDEETDPAFSHHGPGDLPTYESDGLWARLIAGEGFGAKAKVKTHSPMFYAHWRLAAGAKAQLPAEYPERAAYVVAGEVEVDGRTFAHSQMLVFAPGKPVVFAARTDAVVMLLGGEPLGERFIEWNFVSSSKERLEQAKADWRAGRMKLPDLDHDEFIPLPPDPPPAASPLG